jgi:hypothetical protein
VPVVPSIKRKAEIVQHPLGYTYVRYSGKREEVKLNPRESIHDLLKLVPPYTAVPSPLLSVNEEDFFNSNYYLNASRVRDDLDPNAVIEFLNKWGLVGLLNPSRDKMQSVDEFWIRWLLGVPAGRRFDVDNLLLDDLNQIAKGNVVPFTWIQDSLRQLAKMVRLTLNLLSSQAIHKSSVDFEQKTMKRILASWNELPFVFDDGEDPGGSQFKFRKQWQEKPVNRKLLLDPGKCEDILSQFAYSLNQYVAPITSQVLMAGSWDEIVLSLSCYETALCTYLLSSWSDLTRAPKRCDECKNLYIPQRVKTDARFCGKRCKETFHKRESRKRQRAKSEENSTFLKVDINKSMVKKGETK